MWTKHSDNLGWSIGHMGQGYLLRDGTVKTWCVDPFRPTEHQERHQLDGDQSLSALNFEIDPDGGVVTQAPSTKVDQIVQADPKLYDAGQRPVWEDNWDLSGMPEPTDDGPHIDYNFVMSGNAPDDTANELHVGLAIPDDMSKRIRKWVDEQDWPSGTEMEDPADYHITLMYSPDGHDEHGDDDWEHTEGYDVEVTGIDEFGDEEPKAIVLRINSPEVKGHANAMQTEAEGKGLEISKFPGGYKPHLTIAYGPGKPKAEPPHWKFRSGPSSVSTPRTSATNWEGMGPMQPQQINPKVPRQDPRSNIEMIYNQIGEAAQAGDMEMAQWLYQFLPEGMQPQMNQGPSQDLAQTAQQVSLGLLARPKASSQVDSRGEMLEPASELEEWLNDIGQPDETPQQPPSIHHDNVEDTVLSPAVSPSSALTYFPPAQIPKEYKQAAESPSERWCTSCFRPGVEYRPYGMDNNYERFDAHFYCPSCRQNPMPMDLTNNPDVDHQIYDGWMHSASDLKEAHDYLIGPGPMEFEAAKTADSPINQADHTNDSLGKNPSPEPSRQLDMDYLDPMPCPHCQQRHRPDEPCPDSSAAQFKIQERQWHNRDPNAIHQARPYDWAREAHEASEPPNLRSSNSSERCSACEMFDNGECWGYGNREVRPDQVCDSYERE